MARPRRGLLSNLDAFAVVWASAEGEPDPEVASAAPPAPRIAALTAPAMAIFFHMFCSFVCRLFFEHLFFEHRRCRYRTRKEIVKIAFG